MVIVKICLTSGRHEVEVGRIHIRRTEKHDDGTADYAIQYGVERGTAVGLHTRGIDAFPRKHYNVLALLLQALNTLSPKELELERGFDPDHQPPSGSSDLARRLNRAGEEVQGGEDQRDHY